MPRAFAAALGVKHSTLLGAFASAGVPVSSLRGDIPLVMLATLGAILAAQIISKLLLRPLRGARDPKPRDAREPSVVLVTGASSGLGKLVVDAVSEAFPSAVVYGTSRSGWQPPRKLPWSPSRSPRGIEPRDDNGESRLTDGLLQLDVTDEASVERCVNAIVDRHGKLDVLINNAGAVIATRGVATKHDDAKSQMETNFFGMVRTVRCAVPAMTGPYKRIINIGSIGGRIGLPFQSMYSASKAAVMVWTDALRMETWSSGVRVSLVEPGDLKPGMVNAAKADGFDDDAIASRAFDIMRKEEAEGTDPKAVARAIVRSLRSPTPAGRVLIGPDAWLVEILGRLVPHAWKEFFLASHYRVPPRHDAWIRV